MGHSITDGRRTITPYFGLHLTGNHYPVEKISGYRLMPQPDLALARVEGKSSDPKVST